MAQNQAGRGVSRQPGQGQLMPRGSALRGFGDVDRLFDSLLRGWMRPFGEETAALSVPAIDVIDHDKDIVVRAEVPGYTKDDIELTMSDSTLVIRGHTHEERKEEEENYYYQEMTRGEFTRSVPLPAEVNAEHVKAKIKDGILEVTLPKAETSPRRSIKIDEAG